MRIGVDAPYAFVVATDNVEDDKLTGLARLHRRFVQHTRFGNALRYELPREQHLMHAAVFALGGPAKAKARVRFAVEQVQRATN